MTTYTRQDTGEQVDGKTFFGHMKAGGWDATEVEEGRWEVETQAGEEFELVED